jgi:hypothetical protein
MPARFTRIERTNHIGTPTGQKLWTHQIFVLQPPILARVSNRRFHNQAASPQGRGDFATIIESFGTEETAYPEAE